jgi:hypothetical protein
MRVLFVIGVREYYEYDSAWVWGSVRGQGSGSELYTLTAVY